jgi:hypothetical protein
MQRATPSCEAAETTRLACAWSIYPRLPPAGRTLVANMVIKSQTQADQVRFGVAMMESPPTATLLKASTKQFLTSIPGTTPSLLRKHPPDSIATAKDHLHFIRQGLRSTKRSIPAEQDVELDSAFPTAHPGRPARIAHPAPHTHTICPGLPTGIHGPRGPLSLQIYWGIRIHAYNVRRRRQLHPCRINENKGSERICTSVRTGPYLFPRVRHLPHLDVVG